MGEVSIQELFLLPNFAVNPKTALKNSLFFFLINCVLTPAVKANV